MKLPNRRHIRSIWPLRRLGPQLKTFTRSLKNEKKLRHFCQKALFFNVYLGYISFHRMKRSSHLGRPYSIRRKIFADEKASWLITTSSLPARRSRCSGFRWFSWWCRVTCNRISNLSGLLLAQESLMSRSIALAAHERLSAALTHQTRCNRSGRFPSAQPFFLSTSKGILIPL